MPDWNILIDERLPHLALPQELREEVVVELASHIEEVYQDVRSRGVSESEAIALALGQVASWQDLARKIKDAKKEEERMNPRTKQLWLPGLATLTASMGWLMILQRENWHLHDTFFHGGPPLMPYLIWLLTQPVFGAMGAYLSRLAGGDRRARLAAGIFPSIAMLGLLVFIGLMAFYVEQNPFVWKHPAYFGLIIFPWVIFPGIALLVGVFPFLKSAKPGPA
jgi:hypothetical protein